MLADTVHAHLRIQTWVSAFLLTQVVHDSNNNSFSRFFVFCFYNFLQELTNKIR